MVHTLNSNINFTRYGAIHLTTTNYPNWSAAYKVSVPSEHEHISAFESWVGEEETFHLSCTGWLRTRSQIWSKELIVFDDSSGEDEVSFAVNADGTITSDSYFKGTGLKVQDAGGINFTVDADGTLVSDSYLRGTGLKVYNAGELNFDVNTDGEVRARKVTLNTDTWSDFVFDNEYRLMSIDEVENFIAEHNHLPGVPGEAEVTTTGVDVAEMDKILLQKIEELTLYIIALKKEINELKKDQ